MNPTEVTAQITLIRPGVCQASAFGQDYWFYGEIESTHELRAEVIEDNGDGFTSELCVVWLDAAHVADLNLTPEELDGAIEAIEAAYVSPRGVVKTSGSPQADQVAL